MNGAVNRNPRLNDGRNAHNNEAEGQSLRRLFIRMQLHVFLNLFVHLLANAGVMAAAAAAVLLAHCSINLIHLR